MGEGVKAEKFSSLHVANPLCKSQKIKLHFEPRYWYLKTDLGMKTKKKICKHFVVLSAFLKDFKRFKKICCVRLMKT